MTPPRRRSKKRSAANSTSGLPDGVVFYLDESIYSKRLLLAMREAGATVEHVRGAIPAGLNDVEWLAIVGRNGWVAVMRDQAIRRRKLEREALKAAAVAAFVYTGGEATAQETADAIVPRLRKMTAIARSERRPFLYGISRGGSLSKIRL